ncbi:MAG TPA: 30S ribosomal protein S3 [Thermotogota bacterium]|nr:30S ribosomal protein S3 [Thermotogota bacterium]HRW33478.1 30S ribosomal protein S3 [Thermotogota bacterium]
MGQKVHPRGFRLGVSEDWQANWFGGKNYSDYLIEDEKIRTMIRNKRYKIKTKRGQIIDSDAAVDEVYIERPSASKVKISIHTAKPGIVIGKKGAEVQVLREELEKLTSKQCFVNIKEIKTPETDALLVAENVAAMLEKRTSHKRAMKRVMRNAMKSGAKGIKVMVSGRLGGAEIARVEWYREGRIPLQTLRAKIDYGYTVANTKSGVIGVKVWVYTSDK